MYIPFCKFYQFFVIAYCDLSDWVEVKPLYTLSSQAVADFFWEDVICPHSYFRKWIINRGLENKDVVAELAKKNRIKKVVVSAYHPKANGIIERGHKPIVDALLKMLIRGSTNWVWNLPTVLWADRLIVHMSISFTLYYIN